MQTLKAHVAADYLDGSTRVFIFAPTDESGRSVASLQLDASGDMVSAKATVKYAGRLKALHRWARVYLRRSTPQSFA